MVMASTEADKPPPVRVAARRRARKGSTPAKRKRRGYISPLFDDRGYPHPGDEWDSLLPDVKDGKLLRKRKHDPPRLDNIDPGFGEEYDEAKHGEMLRAELKISHLDAHQQSILTAVV